MAIHEKLGTAYKKAAEHYPNGLTIIDPWDARISPKDRAEHHLMLLDAVYHGGHPGSATTIEELTTRQTEGGLLTWLYYQEGIPIAMANVELRSDGVAELVRTGKMSTANELHASHLMYYRLAEALPILATTGDVWALESDLRLAKSVPLADGGEIKKGVYTQHINRFDPKNLIGLHPFLLSVPRYQVSPKGNLPHQEVFLQSRRYLEPDRVVLEPLYTPKINCSHPRSPSIADIGRVTISHAFAVQPEVVEDSYGLKMRPEYSLEQTAGIHFSTLKLSGNVESEKIKQLVDYALANSRFLEVVVDNHPANIELQRRLYVAGAVPMGTFPGRYLNNERGMRTTTTHHFGFARSQIVDQMVEIEMASDYNGTEFPYLCQSLWEMWKIVGANRD